jgi:hypothetical protein
MSETGNITMHKARFLAKGPRAAENPDDDRLWFLVDTQSGMPVWDKDGIAWFTRTEAKARAAKSNVAV